MATVLEKEQEYRQYIDTHRANVQKAYDKIVKNFAMKHLSPNSVEILERNIQQHDEDKDIDFIFNAYRKNHFPVDEEEKKSSEEEYKIAWDYHKKVNPHHWQFFLDDNDEEFTQPELSEEEEEIYRLAYLEMLADWLSFSFKQAQEENGTGDGISTKGDSIEFEDWYNKNKDTIKIHPQLREWLSNIIEEVIKYIKENKNILSEGIIRREKYHEDNNTFLIQVKIDGNVNCFMKLNPEAITYSLTYDYTKATMNTNREEMRLLLVKFLNKYKLKAAKVVSIAELEKDMKDNPGKYDYTKEIELDKMQRIENNIFTDRSPKKDEEETQISQAIYSSNDNEEKEDFSIYSDK